MFRWKVIINICTTFSSPNYIFASKTTNYRCLFLFCSIFLQQEIDFKGSHSINNWSHLSIYIDAYFLIQSFSSKKIKKIRIVSICCDSVTTELIFCLLSQCQSNDENNNFTCISTRFRAFFPMQNWSFASGIKHIDFKHFSQGLLSNIIYAVWQKQFFSK